MVIRGRTRGNGKQLAQYLLTPGDNEQIQIMDVDGKEAANNNDLRRALLTMSLTSELTKSDKGLYHVVINPAIGEDKDMTPEKWFQCAAILEEKTGYVGQRRAVILHTKQGRTHAHVVYERYDHVTGKMISDSFSRLAQDEARKEMEVALNHQPTPDRNPNRPAMKTYLTELWGRTKSGDEFIQEAAKEGYTVAAGLQRRPFMVVDREGRSFDLVRQLDKVKTKEVRERLQNLKLIEEKKAIANVRKKQKEANKQAVNDNDKKTKLAMAFAESRSDIVKDDPSRSRDERKRELMEAFKQAGSNATKEQSPDKETKAKAFAENTRDALSKQEQIDALKELFKRPGKEKGKGFDFEP